jgi:raffinose/stachyose/melibiose transport system substrate-binding protein
MKKYFFKIFGFTLSMLMITGLAACSKPTANSNSSKKNEEIVIRMATNYPDQETGIGKLEKEIAKAYMAKNENIKIIFELNDNEVHRQKLKIYASSNKMPDIYMNWADPSALVPMVKGGYAAELNLEDFSDYNFIKGALEDCSYENKLFGLPRTFDIWFMMYNEKIFKDNNIEFPKTIEEMKKAAEYFNSKGIIPCVMNGKDNWNEVVLLHDLMIRTNGNQELVPKVFEGGTTFSEEENAIQAANLLVELSETGFFQKGYLTADYSTAQNLFVQGEAAMYYIGSWELGMASRKDFPEELTKNLRGTYFPIIAEAGDTSKDVIGRTGGLYSINPNSKVKDEAIDFLKYMYKPENWAKQSWQLGLCAPAQDWSSFTTGKETQLQNDITNMISELKSTSSFMYAWKLTPSFEQDCLNSISELLVGNITAKEYWQKVDKSAEKNKID